jgi:DNA phosphorothioation system restriction enzyme
MVDALNQLLPLGNCLSVAVGYFYLSGFDLIQDAFSRIAHKGGVRIIMGRRTDPTTARELEAGLALTKPEKLLHGSTEDLAPAQALRLEVINVPSGSSEAKVAYRLRDLVKQGLVRVKVYTGPADYFHAKVYLIGREVQGDGYGIVGSSNFSRGGFTSNSELNVLTKDAFPKLVKWFDTLWESEQVVDYSLDLIELIEANIDPPTEEREVKREVIEVLEDQGEASEPGVPVLPPYLVLRDYQKIAIREWFKTARGRGIWEMATGTGKTITALAAAAYFCKKYGRLAIIVVCPFQHLVEQWGMEAERFGMIPILCHRSKDLWEDRLNAKITSFNMGAIKSFCAIMTNDTLSTQAMQKTLGRIAGDTMVIADEVHHLGSPRRLKSLPANANLRLGLSATPVRWYDDSGTKALEDYFENGVVFTFGLKEAIGHYLTEYYYYPHLVQLTEHESEEYVRLTHKIVKRFGSKGPDFELTEDLPLKKLLVERARLLSGARNKLRALKELMMDRTDTRYNLFYCADTRVGGVRQVDEVVSILGRELGMHVHPFTAQENLKERRDLLRRFETGDLQGLVAMKCLDEGVDIPATQTAYILASSANPREFIQRRGRILRQHPAKKYSCIHDFIVIPGDINYVEHLSESEFRVEQAIVKRELRRFREFASLAINGPQASYQLIDLVKAYRLFDI